MSICYNIVIIFNVTRKKEKDYHLLDIKSFVVYYISILLGLESFCDMASFYQNIILYYIITRVYYALYTKPHNISKKKLIFMYLYTLNVCGFILSS